MVYNAQQKLFAESLDVSPPAVQGWLKGGDIKSSSLIRMHHNGINVIWLLDDSEDDMRNMFADNAAGDMLRAKVFGGLSANTQSVRIQKAAEPIETDGSGKGDVVDPTKVTRTAKRVKK